jgi:hypothetical protein
MREPHRKRRVSRHGHSDFERVPSRCESHHSYRSQYICDSQSDSEHEEYRPIHSRQSYLSDNQLTPNRQLRYDRKGNSRRNKHHRRSLQHDLPYPSGKSTVKSFYGTQTSSSF